MLKKYFSVLVLSSIAFNASSLTKDEESSIDFYVSIDVFQKYCLDKYVDEKGKMVKNILMSENPTAFEGEETLDYQVNTREQHMRAMRHNGIVNYCDMMHSMNPLINNAFIKK